MLRRRAKMPLVGAAAVAVLLSGCSVLNGGDDDSSGGESSGDGSTDVTDQVGAWDMCKVLSPDPILEEVAGSQYLEGFEPHHVGLGSAMDAEAISCAATIESPLTDEDDSAEVDILLSVFPGMSTEHVDDMWEIRQTGWYEENVNAEGGQGDLTADDLVIDKDLEGDWDEGHAYALFGTEGETAGESGQVIVNVRTENYMVEAHVFVPSDPAKTQAARYGLDQSEIDARTSLAFDRVDFVNWVADEHIYTMFESVTNALEDDSEVQR